MGHSLAEIAPTGEIGLYIIGLSGKSYDSYILDKLDDRSLKLISKEPGRLTFYITTAKGTLNFNDLSNPIDVFLSADGETCEGRLSYENDALVMRFKEDSRVIKVAIFSREVEARIEEMVLMRRSAKEIVLKSAMPYVTFTIYPLNKLDDLIYETSCGPIKVKITEQQSREFPDVYTGLFFEELGAIILIID